MRCTITSIINLSIELDRLVETSQHFFCPELLYLLDREIELHYTVVEVYDKNTPIQTFYHNIKKEVMDEQYNYHIRTRDCFTKYIRKNWAYVKRSKKLLLSTEIIPAEEYDTNDYICFISQMGLYYSACMPFEGVYLAIHKLKENGDFTSVEIECLGSLYKLLQHKYEQWKKQITLRSAHKRESELLSDMKIGILIFDEGLRLITYNPFAIKYVSQLCGGVRLDTLFNDLYQKLNLPPTVMDNDWSGENSGFSIAYQYYYETDCYQIFHRYLSVTIRQSQTHVNLPAELEAMNTLSARELQVVECLSCGQTYQAVADELFISINTVRTHLKNCYKKLGVNNQRALVQLFMQFKNLTF